MAVINWVHVGFVAPMLSYIVYENSNNRVLKEGFLTFLTIVIIVMFMFHLFKGIMDLNKPEQASS